MDINKLLEQLRSDVDDVDAEICKLVDLRMRIVRAIGKMKQENCIPLRDPAREVEIKARAMSRTNGSGMDQAAIDAIYSTILQQALRLMQCSTPSRS